MSKITQLSSKEEVLEELKSLVHRLIYHEKDMDDAEKLEWEKRRCAVDASLSKREPEDMRWLDANFKPWFLENIEIPPNCK